MLGLANAADVRTLVFTGMYYATSAYLWTAPLRWSLLTPAVLCCLLAFQCAVATHNQMHLAMFGNDHLNTVWRVILTLAYGHPTSTFIPGHNISHHAFMQQQRDHMRTSKVQFKWNLLNLLLFMPIVAGDVLWGDVRYALVQYRRKTHFHRRLSIEFGALAAVSIWLAYTDIKRFLLFVQIPHYFAQWAIATLNLLQHDGCDVPPPADPLMHKSPNYNGSRNFTGLLINFFCYNNGYHTIHHLHPRMHWSLLRDEHQKQVLPHIHPNLDQSSMPRYIYQAFFNPGLRVDYLGNPVIFPAHAVGPDIDWLTYPKGMDPLPDTLFQWLSGLVRSASFLCLALPIKVLAPGWSPLYEE